MLSGSDGGHSPVAVVLITTDGADANRVLCASSETGEGVGETRGRSTCSGFNPSALDISYLIVGSATRPIESGGSFTCEGSVDGRSVAHNRAGTCNGNIINTDRVVAGIMRPTEA